MNMTENEEQLILLDQVAPHSKDLFSQPIRIKKQKTEFPKTSRTFITSRDLYYIFRMSKSVYIRETNTVGILFPQNVSVRCGGRTLGYDDVISGGSFVTLSVKLFGGKGGYGQLLKDFGKETQLSRNKKSMRDLSGTLIWIHMLLQF